MGNSTENLNLGKSLLAPLGDSMYYFLHALTRCSFSFTGQYNFNQ